MIVSALSVNVKMIRSSRGQRVSFLISPLIFRFSLGYELKDKCCWILAPRFASVVFTLARVMAVDVGQFLESWTELR